MYGAGSPYNDGAGVLLCQAAGAQMGKNFSTSINELGAANAKSSDFIVGNVAETPLFCLPLFGGLFVAGADADLWAVPYFEGGSAQGFCAASGYLAGLVAAGGSIKEA